MPVLGDLTIAGQPRKVVMFANRNGFFYVLDRATGKLLLAKPFTGRGGRERSAPMDGRSCSMIWARGRSVCPIQRGGTNFMPPSYDPVRGSFS